MFALFWSAVTSLVRHPPDERGTAFLDFVKAVSHGIPFATALQINLNLRASVLKVIPAGCQLPPLPALEERDERAARRRRDGGGDAESHVVECTSFAFGGCL